MSFDTVLSFTSLILSGFSLAVVIMVAIDHYALKNSTHKVMMYDHGSQEFTSLTDEQKKELGKPLFDNI